MEPRHAMTVTGIGEDGNEYVIHGYKQIVFQGGKWTEEALASIFRTEDGEVLMCGNENPLWFWRVSDQLRISCDESAE